MKDRNRVMAAIYARVSCEQQSREQTIASQVEALQARVARDGLALEDESCFVDDGYSGGTLVRPALERLRDQAAVGAIDRLYVHSPRPAGPQVCLPGRPDRRAPPPGASRSSS